jgi:hypothetical protein
MGMRTTALLVLLLGTIGTAADRHWQTGRCVDLVVKRQVVDFGPGATGFDRPNATAAMRAMADVTTYVIETDDLHLELREVRPIGRQSVDAMIGDAVTFALEKNTAYVRDAAGVEHKLRVTKKATRKKPL